MAGEQDERKPHLETFTVGSSRFLLAPENGFRLMRWTLETVSGSREILHWPEDAGDQAIEKVRGGNPLLFPFAGRSFDRGLENHWRAPDGSRLPMPRHGFARGGRFAFDRASENEISGRLLPTEADAAAFPFDYVFTVQYRFQELSVQVDLCLENTGEEPVPWSAGHHFYFTLPWHAAARRRDYRLNMEARKCAYHAPDGKLVMDRDRETCHVLADTDLLDRIHWQLRHNRVSFGPKGGEEDIHLILGDQPAPQKNWSIVTWSESETAPYYCIEPWMGPPNAAEHGKGLHWVGPGESQTFRVEVSLY
ncbi:MAG: aldose epimerase [Puniceicoccaceae bacterium]